MCFPGFCTFGLSIMAITSVGCWFAVRARPLTLWFVASGWTVGTFRGREIVIAGWHRFMFGAAAFIDHFLRPRGLGFGRSKQFLVKLLPDLRGR